MRNPPKFSREIVVLCEAKGIDGRSVQVLLPLLDTKVDVAPIPKEAQNPAPYPEVILVTNFEVFSNNSSQAEPLTDFGENPFELRVAYTVQEWQASQENKNFPHPWLEFWDMNSGVWREFKNVYLDPVDGNPATGGYLIVKIPNWEDPPIGIVT